MALGTTARPLLVPAADVLAKNMRALESARLDTAPSRASDSPAVSLFTVAPQSPVQPPRFRRASADAKPNPIVAAIKRFLRPPPSSADAPRAALPAALEKALPALEKAAAIASRLPDPTLVFLALVLAVLLVDRLRPHWFDSLIARIAAILSFVVLLAVAGLWRKTELFAQLREGRDALTHPAERRFDATEAEVRRRQAAVADAQRTLRDNRSRLDALRRELAKDSKATEKDAVIVPSRKAAAMIAAGALGAGYDERAAGEVERRRKEESLKRSREEWRARTEETQGDVQRTQENIKLMADHAAKAYTKRTREIKTQSNVGGGKSMADKVGLRRRGSGTGGESDSRRVSRMSDASAATSVAASAGSKKRLFQRFLHRRRTTGGTGSGGGRDRSQSEAAVRA